MGIRNSAVTLITGNEPARGGKAMWDTVETTTTHLSHDMPCPGCGHATHTFLSCSDTCDCVPAPLPGMVLAHDAA
jgi:hypothetical protein